MFDAAEGSGAILFFDGADVLFGRRTEVRDGHDRYANMEINHLLERMEHYAGLKILAMNRRCALESFLRRFRFVVDFPVPVPVDRRRVRGASLPGISRPRNPEVPYLAPFGRTAPIRA